MREHHLFPSIERLEARRLLAADAIHSLKDFTFDSSPANLFDFDGQTLFAAAAGSGTELYITDGTAAGTRLLKDINPGTADSNPKNFFRFGDEIFFNAVTAATGTDLWATDGTVAGTRLVKDVSGVVAGPEKFVAFNGQLFFVIGGSLWRTDGTDAGTFRVSYADGSAPKPVVMGGKLYFSAYDDAVGTELFSVDSNGTVQLVADLRPGSFDSYPDGLAAAGNQLFISASPTAGLKELFVSDGTTAGTHKVLNGSNLPLSSPKILGAAGSRIYVVALNGTTSGASSLLSTDGTPAGTVSLDSSTSTTVTRYAVLGNLVLFPNSGSGGEELWCSDGTVAGTSFLYDARPGSSSSSPKNFSIHDGFVYFEANTSAVVTGTFVTDGTVAGTSQYTHPYAPGSPKVASGLVMAAGDHPRLGEELYAFNPATDAVSLVIDVDQQVTSAPSNRSAVFRGGAYTYFESAGRLFRTDGTTPGTLELGDFGTLLDGLTGPDGKFYFITSTTRTLGVSDGTVAGTKKLASLLEDGVEIRVALDNKIAVLVRNGTTYQIFSFTSAGGLINAAGLGTYSEAHLGDVLSAGILFMGVQSGSSFLKSIQPGFGANAIGSPVTGASWKSVGVVGGTAYLILNDPNNNKSSLYRTDGFSAVLVKEAATGEMGFGVEYQGWLHFFAQGGVFKTNGSTVTRYADLPGGALDRYVQVPRAAVMGGLLYFIDSSSLVTDPNNPPPAAPFSTDGTAAGTAMITSLGLPLTGSTSPQRMVATNDRLYIDDNKTRIYSSDGTAAGTGLESGSTGLNLAGNAATLGHAVVAVTNSTVYRVASSSAASIHGVAFDDSNLNGVQDGIEPVAFHRRVFIDANNNGLLDASEGSEQTDASGAFHFAGLPAGTHRIRQQLASGIVTTTAAANVTVTSGQSVSGIMLGAGDGLPPIVWQKKFFDQEAPLRAEYRFNETLAAMNESNVTLTNLETGQIIPLAPSAVSWHAGLRRLTVQLNSVSLPTAVYSLTTSATDTSGNTLSNGGVLNFVNLTWGGSATLSSVIGVSGFVLGVGGNLDIGNYGFAYTYDGTSPRGTWNGTNYTGFTGSIAIAMKGYSGIRSTLADGFNTTTGIIEASAALGLSGAQTATWRGQTVGAKTLLVARVRPGDANLDGLINGDDYFRIDSHAGQTGVGYANGDFNYDSLVDGDDYFLIDRNLNKTGPLAAPALGAIPSSLIAVQPSLFEEASPEKRDESLV